MIFEFNTDNIGHNLAQITCDGLSKFLNQHVLSSGNSVKLAVPYPEKGDGHYRIKINIEIEERPFKKFGQK